MASQVLINSSKLTYTVYRNPYRVLSKHLGICEGLQECLERFVLN